MCTWWLNWKKLWKIKNRKSCPANCGLHHIHETSPPWHTVAENLLCILVLLANNNTDWWTHTYCIKRKQLYYVLQLYQLLSENHYALLSALFLLHRSMNQGLFEKHLCNQTTHYEKYRWFLLHKATPSCATT